MPPTPSSRESLFVISDLHLGGDTGFQMCTARGRRRLASFLRALPALTPPVSNTHLLLAGDIVDFLAEEPFAAFTADDTSAQNKLARLMDHGDTADVWDSLRDLTAAGHALTLMLGNHDLELSLPGPRRLLQQRTGLRGVDFLYDNQACVRGPVVIEHGNRYDPWNTVSHDALRAVRSALTRRERPPPMPTVPGSELVVQVMNPLKQRLAFVDLLKPETAAVLPVLAVLEPRALEELQRIFALVPRTWSRRDESGVPRDRGQISAGPKPPDPMREARALLGQDRGDIGLMRDLRSWWEVYLAGTAEERRERIERLRKALRLYVREQTEAFAVDREIDRYLAPAKALAARGFRVVVFGHTHLVKRVTLPGGALYLNTGTWADLMRIPAEILSEAPAGDKTLTEFIEAVAQNRIEPYREQLPTFARIDLDGNTLLSADVFIYQDDGTARPVPRE